MKANLSIWVSREDGAVVLATVITGIPESDIITAEAGVPTIYGAMWAALMSDLREHARICADESRSEALKSVIFLRAVEAFRDRLNGEIGRVRALMEVV